MTLKESTIAKIGLVALALVEWRHAALIVWGGLMPLHPFAIGLVLALYLTSFALILTALSNKELEAPSAWWLGPMALVLVAFVYQDAIHKTQSDVFPTTDGHAYMDVAARMLLHGQNPYSQSLLVGYRVFHLPLRFSTPLVNGDFSDRMAYPALSFLVLVPAALAHLPTYLVYGISFFAIIAVLVLKAPWWARGLVFALFTVDETFLSMSFGGVTDSVWALCLVLAAIYWRRTTLMAVCIGLACAQKQHPWFLVPFLLVRLVRESGDRPWTGAPRKFLLVVAGIFLAINLPFVLWSPTNWVLGVVEPLVAPMAQLSEGLTALGMTSYIVIPKAFSSALFWLTFAYALFAYIRHTSVLRDFCWVIPGIVLWFGYRALMSYWYFYALPAVAGFVVAGTFAPLDDEKRKPMLTWALGSTLAGGAILALVIFGLKDPAFDVAVNAPMETFETHVFRLHVRLTNRHSSTLIPRFTVQSSSLQPMQWIIDFGPPALDAGATGDYVIRGGRPFNAFEIGAGARITVSDASNSSLRGVASIAPDTSIMKYDRIPNGRFAFVESRNGLPYAWSLDSSDNTVLVEDAPNLDASSRIALVFEEKKAEPAESTSPAACVPSQKLEAIRSTDRFGVLSTVIELPPRELTIDVNVPADANRPPWSSLYGLHLAARGFQGYVLFGAAEPKGKLPSGDPFVSVEAPRGAWHTVTLHVRDVLEALGAPLEVRRFTYVRFPDIDIPATPIQIGLFASNASAKTSRVEFGAITNVESGEVENALVDRGIKRWQDGATWHAAFDLEMGNLASATTQLERAVRSEPTLERLTLLGDIELRAGHNQNARDNYARALAIASVPETEKGMGWALIGMQDPLGALPHLERARDQFSALENLPPRGGYLDTLRALAVANDKLKDCVKARSASAAIHDEDPHLPLPELENCK